jgi:hypothetical protein
MRLKNTLITAVCVALGLGLAQTTVAHGGDQKSKASHFPKRCFLDGTAWLGDAVGFGMWTATIHAGTHRPNRFVSGSMDLDFINPDVTLGGVFGNASSGTNSIGAWRRTGPRSFDWTWLMHVLDDEGALVYLLKPSGTIQLSDDCLEADLTAALDLYDPEQDPLGDELPRFGGSVPFPGAITMWRLDVVDPFCAE